MNDSKNLELPRPKCSSTGRLARGLWVSGVSGDALQREQNSRQCPVQVSGLPEGRAHFPPFIAFSTQRPKHPATKLGHQGKKLRVSRGLGPPNNHTSVGI